VLYLAPNFNQYAGQNVCNWRGKKYVICSYETSLSEY
jgi:hypothetical protein